MTQAKKGRGFPVMGIPDTNHKVRPTRKLGSGWDVVVGVQGQIAGWSSHRLAQLTEGSLDGADKPTIPAVASLSRITYERVTGIAFDGAATEAQDYLAANSARGGSLVIVGEIPYQPTLLHERQAVDAMAKLAGLNLHYTSTAPMTGKSRLMSSHVLVCGVPVVLVG